MPATTTIVVIVLAMPASNDPAELPVWIKGIAKLARAEYHEPSAQDARRRIVNFFDTHVK